VLIFNSKTVTVIHKNLGGCDGLDIQLRWVDKVSIQKFNWEPSWETGTWKEIWG